MPLHLNDIEKGLQELPKYRMPDYLDQKIKIRITQTRVVNITKPQLWWAAAAAILILGLNLSMILSNRSKKGNEAVSYTRSITFDSPSLISEPQ